MSKLGLGTVQFGQAYGVSNVHGQVPVTGAANILRRATEAGIGLLDTAANYGEAETVLAGLNTASFRIVTKTINLNSGLDAVLARARQSAETLKADTLLVHAAANLANESFWPALQQLKSEGVFRKIGISAYAADNPAALAKRFKPDVMQLPFSLLDQRLLADGSLAEISAMGVEIHARSLFLQGLLLMNSVPEHLVTAGPRLKAIRTEITAAGSTPLAAALGFVLSRPEITCGLVGVTSVIELEEILSASNRPLPDLNWASLSLNDERVLTPSLW